MISEKRFNGDGSKKIFPVEFIIQGEEFIRVYVDGLLISDLTTYDIINNSIVFSDDNIPGVGSENIQVWVASSIAEIEELPLAQTNIDIVANNINDINDIINNLPDINEVQDNLSNINIVANNEADIDAIVAQVVPNLSEILLADDNATIATTKASEAAISASEAAISASEAAISASSVNSNNIVHTDGSGLSNEISTLISKVPLNISSMLEGTISLSNTIQSIGFKTQLYTGNGTSQDIVTGVNMKDNWADYSSLALWSAGTYNTDDEVYILDSSSRKLRVVCLQDGVTSDPNTLLDFTDATFSDWKIESKTFGGRVWIKNRDTTDSHQIIDTIREATNRIESDNTSIETVISNGLTSFSNSGFSVGSDVEYNTVSENYTSWTDQTTFCESGLTNQNKPYIRETNAVTGYVQIKYKGSGTAGHEIPHGMGRELGFTSTKNLTNASSWICQNEFDGSGHYLTLHNNVSIQTSANLEGTVTNTILSLGSNTNINESGSLHILYGCTNSYIDENNILQGNYEIGTYVGTGVSGNKITTKAKPAYVMVKRLDSTGGWIVKNNQIPTSNYMYANTSDTEYTNYTFTFQEDGFTDVAGTSFETNASGGQYLYLVVYDNDLGSGASKYTQATETTQLQINNAILSTSSGYDSISGVDNKISTFNGTVLPTNGWEE